VKPPARPELLLLDAGNTIVFLDEVAVADAARSGGVEIEAARVRSSILAAVRAYEAFLSEGGTHEEAWFVYARALLSNAGADPSRLDAAVVEVRAAHDRFNLWRRVPDGLGEALDSLAASGVRLGVVSNSEGSIAELLAQVGIASHFEIVIDSALVGVRKPDPRIFEIALERLGVASDRAVYAGDVPNVDVKGARAAGMAAVLVDGFDLYEGYEDAFRVRSVAELARLWTA
jgi:HAD superfamily hydrolase (TIGR01662 family)